MNINKYKQIFNQFKYFNINSFKLRNNSNQQYKQLNKGLIKGIFNQFSTKKINKQIKNHNQNNLSHIDDKNQFLWKFNCFLNIGSIALSFYQPVYALKFLLTTNYIFQIYQNSQNLNKFSQFAQKSLNMNQSTLEETIKQMKSILKNIFINKGIFFFLSLSYFLGQLYPNLSDISLLGLNFWILYNIKRSNISQGYYFVILTLVLYQYFYFQKSFQKQDKKQKASVNLQQKN